MKYLSRRHALLVALAALTPLPASAQAEKAADDGDDDRPAVTFAGFRMFSDGRSQIWVHISEQPQVTPKQEDGKVVYTLHDVRLLVRNNQNPLLTEYFHSAVLSARLKRSGNDVELRVRTRKGTGKATHRFHRLKNGAVSLQIEFPKAPPPQPSQPKPAEPEPKE